MGRKVSIRVSYQNDCRFLMRLSEAIEKDASIAIEQRRHIIGLLTDVTVMLTKRAGMSLEEG